MSEEQKISRGGVGRRALAFVLYFLGGLLVLLISLSLLLQSQWGQDILKEQAASYLERKLKTRVSIGSVSIKWLSQIDIHNVVVEDRQQRKLLELGMLHIRLRTLDLLEGKLTAPEIKVGQVSVRLYRDAGDPTFNFQFIPDAFAGDPNATKKPKGDKSSSFKFDIGTVDLSQVTFILQDGWSGMDINLGVRQLGMNMKELDLDKMRFRMGGLALDSGRMDIRAYAGTAPKDTTSSKATLPFITADSLALTRIDFGYSDSSQPFMLHTVFGALKLDAVQADLGKKDIRAGNLLLAKQATSVTLRSAPAKKDAPGTKVAADSSAPYRFSVTHVQVLDNAFIFDDNGKPRARSGFDAAHLGLKQVNLKADSVSYDGKRYVADILDLRGTEQGGFELKQLKAKALYADTAVSLQGLTLQTTQNRIEGDLSLGYASLAALTAKPGKAKLNLNIRKASIRLPELLLFAPDLGKNDQVKPLLGKTFLISTRMTGTVDALRIPSILLTESGTRIEASGTLYNLPDMDRLAMDLQVKTLSGNKKDLLTYLPNGLIADSLLHYIPERFTLKGTAKGSIDDLTAHLSLGSSFGDLRVDGNLKNAMDLKSANYDLRLDLVRFKLGELLQDTTMGELTATVTGKGRGLDPYTMQAAFTAAVKGFLYHGYGYHDIGLDGTIDAGQLRARASSTDPNMDLDAEVAYNMTKGKGSFSTNTQLRNLDLMKLGFMSDTLSISGNIHVELPNLDTAMLQGDVLLESLRVSTGTKRLFLDSLTIKANHTADTQYVALRSKLMTMDVKGQFNFNHIPEAARVIANRYIYTESADTLYRHRVVAEMQGLITLPDSVARMVPGLTKISPIALAAAINTDSSKLAMNILVPHTEYKGMIIDTAMVVGLNFTRDKQFNKLVLVAGTNGVRSSSINITKTFLYGTLYRGVFDGKLSQFGEDIKQVNYNLPFVFTNEPGKLHLHIGDSLRINNRLWSANPDNMLYFGGGGMRNSQLRIQRGNEEIAFATGNERSDGLPMSVSFKKFQLENLGNIIKSDTSFLSGLANGKLEVEDFNPFTVIADLTVDSLTVMGARFGNLVAKARHTDAEHIAVDMALKGIVNDVTLDGQVDTKTTDLAMKLDMKALDLRMAEPFAHGFLADTKGILAGSLSIGGRASNPDIIGTLRFDSAATTLKMVNAYMKLNDAGLRFTKDAIEFDHFIFTDSSGNAARLEGSIRIPDAQTLDANLKLVAQNFRVVGYKRFPDQIAYGPARADASLSLKGDLTSLLTEGTLKLRDSSQVTYVYRSAVSTDRGDGLIEFFDPLHPPDSSAILAAKKKPPLQTAANLYVNVTPSSTVTVVLDEMTGDALQVKGTANLNITKQPGETVNMTGNYTVDDGQYGLTIAGLVHKDFNILKGSSIMFNGDIKKANMDITAIYATRTSAGELMNDVSSMPGIDKQKLGFQVNLMLTKEILKPDIHFELDMDEGDRAAFNGSVYNRLKQVNNIPSELNKQVMGLLALNHFIADNPFSSLGGGGGSSIETQAYSTAGKLLTQELNSLVGNMINDVDINFALDVREDYTTGSAQRNTDLKMGIRRSFANNRLAVYVGSSLALENHNQNANALNGLAEDVTLEYMLTSDGRYRLKGYRVIEQTMIFQGINIKTGVTFVVAIEFGKFKHMFRPRQNAR
jgi:translocation and assembly module TamB